MTADLPLGLLDELLAEAARVAPEVEASLDEPAGRVLVAGGGLRVLVSPGADPAAARALLADAPEVDAVVLVTTEAPYAATVVDAFDPADVAHPSLVAALTALLAPPDADWSDLPAEPIVSTTTVFSNPARIDDTAREAVTATRGSRVQAPAKKAGWGSLEEAADAAWAAERVRAVLGGAEDPAGLGPALDEQAQAGPDL